MSTEAHAAERETPRRPLATVLTIFAGALVVLMRLVRHPASFTPIGALGLFGGARLAGWKAYALPVGLMLVSDFGLWVVTGFNFLYSPLHISRVYVYGSFLIYVWIGRRVRDAESFWPIAGASLLGSLQFFFITNLGVWLTQPWETGVPAQYLYSRDLSGLLSCFAAALPFYPRDSAVELGLGLVTDPRFGAIGLVVGDLFFTGMLFGLQSVLNRGTAPATQIPEQVSA